MTVILAQSKAARREGSGTKVKRYAKIGIILPLKSSKETIDLSVRDHLAIEVKQRDHDLSVRVLPYFLRRNVAN